MSRLIHVSNSNGRVVGSREYSFDLEQGGLQIPTKYTFTGPCNIVEVMKTNISRLIEENTVV